MILLYTLSVLELQKYIVIIDIWIFTVESGSEFWNWKSTVKYNRRKQVFKDTEEIGKEILKKEYKEYVAPEAMGQTI